jgi:hypothetical protein
MFSQAEVNKLLLDAWPERLEKSCVLMVGAKAPRFGTIGSGVLFQIAEAFFLVTAAHVFRNAHLNGLTIGITSDNNRFLVLSGEWYSISLESFEAFEDSVDIAVYRFSQSELAKLNESDFLRMSNVGNPRSNGIYTVVGFPGVLAGVVDGAPDTLLNRALALTIPAHDGPLPALHNFNPKYSIVLDANSAFSTSKEGDQALMSNLSANAQDTLKDLKGMSGGPVWIIATSGTNPASWKRDFPKLIGVQIGIFPESDLLRVTKWECVIKFIRLGWPELSSAIDITSGG